MNLPKCFQDKINTDRGLTALRQLKVVNYKQGKHLILMQQTSRYRCQQFIKLSNNNNSILA